MLRVDAFITISTGVSGGVTTATVACEVLVLVVLVECLALALVGGGVKSQDNLPVLIHG